MPWLTFLIDVAVAAGFVVAALVWGKRIGGAAPWLLALVGAVDAALLVFFRLLFVLGSRSAGVAFEHSLNLLQLLDAASMFLCGILALVAFYLLMPKTVR